MSIVAIGLNHRSAPIELLERMALSVDDAVKLSVEVANGASISENVVVATCNRTEVYVHAERFHDAFEEVRHALGMISGVEPIDFDGHLYVHYADEAVDHAFEVAAGLDSAVLGEHEILGQVRAAWDRARLAGATGPALDLLFTHVLIGGKRVRSETEIGRRTASISQAAIELIEDRGVELAGSKVLMVGAGEVGAGVMAALARRGDCELTLVNRTRAKAEALADDLGARLGAFDDLAVELARADVIITATAAPTAVITETLAAEVELGARPQLLLDLAVPRDIERGVADRPGVDLLVLGDLQAFASRNLEARHAAAAEARTVMSTQIDKYVAAGTAREVAPLIAALHQSAEDIRTSEIERLAKRLGPLDERQSEALEALTVGIVKKLLHEPTVRLRDASGSRRGDRLAQALRELYDLS